MKRVVFVRNCGLTQRHRDTEESVLVAFEVVPSPMVFMGEVGVPPGEWTPR
jgi:hypothetical protein